MDKHRRKTDESDDFDRDDWQDEDSYLKKNQKKRDRDIKELRKKFADD